MAMPATAHPDCRKGCAVIHDNLSFEQAMEVERSQRRRDAVLQLSELRDFTLNGQSDVVEQLLDMTIEGILDMDRQLFTPASSPGQRPYQSTTYAR